MNKSSKHKNSSRAVKSSRNITSKNSLVPASSTPKNSQATRDSRRRNLHKFKSIPAITYRDTEPAHTPHEHFIYHSYNTH